MTSSWLQVPAVKMPSGKSHMGSTGPPVASTFRSRLAWGNAMNRLSGDQNNETFVVSRDSGAVRARESPVLVSCTQSVPRLLLIAKVDDSQCGQRRECEQGQCCKDDRHVSLQWRCGSGLRFAVQIKPRFTD